MNPGLKKSAHTNKLSLRILGKKVEGYSLSTCVNISTKREMAADAFIGKVSHLETMYLSENNR